MNPAQSFDTNDTETQYDPKWVFSTDPNHFASPRYASRGDALAAAKKQGYPYVYIGRTLDVTPSINASQALEQVVDTLADTVGDVTDGYLAHVTEDELSDLQQRLDTVLTAWMCEHKHEPTFYAVEDIEYIDTKTPREVTR